MIEKRFPEFITHIFNSRKVYEISGNQLDLAGNVSEYEAKLLFEVVGTLQPLETVEIGFGQGISSLAILYAKKNITGGIHHVIDPYQNEYNYSGLEMVTRGGLDGLMKFYGDFPENVLPKLENADFVFIDASHLFNLSLLDFIFSDRILKTGGVIGFHDLNFKAIAKLIKYILNNHDYELIKKLNGAKIYKENFQSQLYSSFRNFLRAIYHELAKPNKLRGIGNLVFLRKKSTRGEIYRGFRNF